jgi:chitodextrinase
MRRLLATAMAPVLALALAAPAAAHDPTGVGWGAAWSSTSDGTHVTVRGILRLFHIDDFVDGVGRDGYAVETATGTVALDIDGPAPEAWNGARVRVTGTEAGGRVRVALAHDSSSLVRLAPPNKRRIRAVLASDGQSVRLVGATPSIAAAAASKKVAVILFDFSNDASQPYTTTTAGQVAFSNSNAMANYFAEESRGAVTVTGQVFGWYQIAASNATCDPFTWSGQARAAATAAGANLTGYTNFVYAFPYASSCGWAGLGAMPGSESWNNGAFALRVVAHELGHNFGVHHASSLSCTSGGVRVAISTTCSSSEYGDPFTVMGGGSSEHNHATHLGQFGWLPAAEVRTIGPGGPYQLGSVLDGPAGSDRLLRIDRHDGTWLYLDLRSVHGTLFDDFAPSAPAVNGVTVRISPDDPSPGYGLSQTQLVDTTPATASYADAPLAVGATLTDPITGLQVTTLSAGSGVATLSVLDPIAPGKPGGLQAAPTGATSIALSWTAASDNYGIARYRVLRDGVEVAAPTGTTFNDTGRSPQTTYAYQVIAVDGSGNEGPAATAGATTPPAGADVTPPSAPKTLKATVGATTTKLYWTAATDDFGVAGYKVYRVGVTKPIKTVTGKSVTVKRRNGAGYYVRAFDAAGNLGLKSPTRRT